MIAQVTVASRSERKKQNVYAKLFRPFFVLAGALGAVILGAVILGTVILGATNQADAQVWSLADDFSYASNPNGAWSYSLDTIADPASFPLLPETSRNANDLWGTTFASPPQMWSEAAGFWGIGKNTTGVDQSSGGILWGADEVLLHPGSQRLVIGWTAPADITVDVNYTFEDRGGGQVGYRLQKRSGGVDTVISEFGVGGTTLDGAIVQFHSGQTMLAGDQLLFRIDTWGPASNDITRAAITICSTGTCDPAGVEPLPLPYSEDFNGFTAPAANFNGGQFETGLAVAHTGNLPDWTKSGGGTVHAVDYANVFPDILSPRDFAVMIWQDNVITQATPLDANEAGQAYAVDFEASPAVYQAGVQQTSATDGLLIEVLRGDDSVLATYTNLPGAWAGSTTFVADGFEYVGDGSGNVRIRIGPSAFNSGRFGGAIDNLSVSLVPEPSSLALISLAFSGLGLIGRRRNRA